MTTKNKKKFNRELILNKYFLLQFFDGFFNIRKSTRDQHKTIAPLMA
jgi:hypothetical protein